jgi:antirestriction protein ArdC
MKLTAKAQQVAEEILTAFEKGTVPGALAITFLTRNPNSPCARWSWRNRLLVALQGHADARGFRQWQEVGRHVRAGESALYILGPVQVKKNRDADPAQGTDDEPGTRLVGFRCIPVFGYEQTEGEPVPELERATAYLDTLPLLEVAHHWQLLVKAVAPGDRLGYYRHGTEIGLAVENLATWTHELVHAADDRRGTLTRRSGQQLDNEVVAELGGAILLECLGYTVESDRGGAYRYIASYCQKHSRDLLSVCTELLERTCAAVELILETAEALVAREAAA